MHVSSFGSARRTRLAFVRNVQLDETGRPTIAAGEKARDERVRYQAALPRCKERPIPDVASVAKDRIQISVRESSSVSHPSMRLQIFWPVLAALCTSQQKSKLIKP